MSDNQKKSNFSGKKDKTFDPELKHSYFSNSGLIIKTAKIGISKQPLNYKYSSGKVISSRNKQYNRKDFVLELLNNKTYRLITSLIFPENQNEEDVKQLKTLSSHTKLPGYSIHQKRTIFKYIKLHLAKDKILGDLKLFMLACCNIGLHDKKYCHICHYASKESKWNGTVKGSNRTTILFELPKNTKIFNSPNILKHNLLAGTLHPHGIYAPQLGKFKGMIYPNPAIVVMKQCLSSLDVLCGATRNKRFEINYPIKMEFESDVLRNVSDMVATISTKRAFIYYKQLVALTKMFTSLMVVPYQLIGKRSSEILNLMYDKTFLTDYVYNTVYPLFCLHDAIDGSKIKFVVENPKYSPICLGYFITVTVPPNSIVDTAPYAYCAKWDYIMEVTRLEPDKYVKFIKDNLVSQIQKVAHFAYPLNEMPKDWITHFETFRKQLDENYIDTHYLDQNVKIGYKPVNKLNMNIIQEKQKPKPQHVLINNSRRGFRGTSRYNNFGNRNQNNNYYKPQVQRYGYSNFRGRNNRGRGGFRGRKKRNYTNKKHNNSYHIQKPKNYQYGQKQYVQNFQKNQNLELEEEIEDNQQQQQQINSKSKPQNKIQSPDLDDVDENIKQLQQDDSGKKDSFFGEGIETFSPIGTKNDSLKQQIYKSIPNKSTKRKKKRRRRRRKKNKSRKNSQITSYKQSLTRGKPVHTTRRLPNKKVYHNNQQNKPLAPNGSFKRYELVNIREKFSKPDKSRSDWVDLKDNELSYVEDNVLLDSMQYWDKEQEFEQI